MFSFGSVPQVTRQDMFTLCSSEKLKQDLSLAGGFSLRKADVVNFALNARYSCVHLSIKLSVSLSTHYSVSSSLFMSFSLSYYPCVCGFVLQVKSVNTTLFEVGGEE
jgi:hypothetical protein